MPPQLPRARPAEMGQVTELAARGASPDDVFTAVVEAASALLDGLPTSLVRFEDDGTSLVLAARGAGTPAGARAPAQGDSLAARVRRTGATVRIDDFADIDVRGVRAGWGVRAAVAVPVTGDGHPWGLLAATSAGGPLPDDTEHRLAQFTDVVASAVAAAQAWSRLRDLAEEQRALRTVAELVARGVPPEEVFAAVAAQASGLLQGVAMTLTRFEGDGRLVVVASHGGPASVGRRIAFQPDTLPDRVLRGARVARVDDYRRERDADLAVQFGLRAAVAVPIVVAGDMWGMLTGTSGTALPIGTEHRLQEFADVVATALANVQARAEVQALAEEQAALRRLAELAAREAPVRKVLDALAHEASWLAGVDFGMVLRFEPDGSTQIEALAGAPESFAVGMRAPATGDGSAWRVWRTGRATRADDLGSMSGQWPRMAHRSGFTSSAAAPMRIDESLWGALVVVARHGPLPHGMEDHLSNFSELAGTVIAAAENKARLRASRARVVATADETRRRLRRDVHDSAQQRLVHAIVTLKLARDAIAGGRDPAELVDEALRNAERANRDLRDVIRGILPAALTRGGLAAGLESLVDDVAVPVGLHVTAPRLAPALETTAYFVVAEALTNVVKHAGASHAVVDVRLEGDTLVLDVRDDGLGGADATRGTGLTGLLDRVEAGDGTLTVSSPVGVGTTVHVELPLGRGWGSPEPAGGLTG
jgi:signal transduction histidine kinase